MGSRIKIKITCYIPRFQNIPKSEKNEIPRASTFEGDKLAVFRLTTADEVKEILADSGIKTSCEDPLPVGILKGKVNTEKNFLVFLISDRSSEMMKVSKRKCVEILNIY